MNSFHTKKKKVNKAWTLEKIQKSTYQRSNRDKSSFSSQGACVQMPAQPFTPWVLGKVVILSASSYSFLKGMVLIVPK